MGKCLGCVCLFVVLGAVLHKKQFGRSFVFKNWAGYWGLEAEAEISNEVPVNGGDGIFDVGCLGVPVSQLRVLSQQATTPPDLSKMRQFYQER